jgi:PEP-CTERM motif
MIRAQPRLVAPRTMILGLVACLPLAFAGEARSDVINFTGNVANDFPASPGTTVISGVPGSVAEAPYITQNGWTSGFIVESLRVSYNQATDTIYVGVQTYSIAGDADGNPNPGSPDPQLAAAGGVNLPGFGGDKSLTLAFASVAPGGGVGATDFVAGIPANKALGDSANPNDFTVATYRDTGQGLGYAYGTILQNHVGTLEVNPTAAAPNFEFAITNASQIPGFNAAGGFYISLFMGSQAAIVVGKEALGWALVPPIVSEPEGITANGGPIVPPSPGGDHPAGAVPEPASVVLFLIGAAGVLGVSRRRRRTS